MRKFLYISVLIIALLCGQRVEAQSADQMVARVTSFFAERADGYRVRFVVNMEGMDAQRGEYVVAGKKYHIEVMGQEQFSDGLYLYGVDGVNMEVTIDRIDPESRNLLVNPLRAFDFGGEAFEVSVAGESDTAVGRAVVLHLVPREGVLDGVRRLVLYALPDDGRPVELRYDFNGLELSVQVESVEKLKSVNDKKFQFSATEFKNYEIIDFR
ncbi:MAG: hypothetical protein J6V31_01270 [Tidjanibacter sp.]|nr:hypothetical protein [Tidjanibacter sp.]